MYEAVAELLAKATKPAGSKSPAHAGKVLDIRVPESISKLIGMTLNIVQIVSTSNAELPGANLNIL